MSEIAGGFGGYLQPVRGKQTQVDIVKVDNGYTVQLQEQIPYEPPTATDYPNPFEGMDSDEVVDKMIDGMGAAIRAINDKGAGEGWKDDADRQLIREGFKMLFPGLTRRAQPYKAPKQPRFETRVFESKEDLVKYLLENL